MKLLSSSSLLVMLSIIDNTYGQEGQRSFTDDARLVHTTRRSKPKIICSARTALSLHHQFKIDPSQIVGTYGNFFPRGSIGDMNDPKYQPYWPVDPTPSELDFLKKIPTFSPSCYHAKNKKCLELDVNAAIAAKPEKWIEVGNGGFLNGSDVKKITSAMGNLPVFISTQYEGDSNPGCITYDQSTGTFKTSKLKCVSRSLLDVIKRTNELGTFLGVPKIDTAKDQAEFCAASKELSEAALSAQAVGIRVMTVNPMISDDNAVTLYPISPLSDPFLRSYEELGVPIMYPGKHKSAQTSVERIQSSEWFTDCIAGQMFANCNKNAFYPVDLYLVEGRRFFFNTPEEQYFLKTFFPDKALLNNQIAHWPLNDGAISYTSATRTFNEMSRKLQEAVRQYDTTKCVNADVTATAFLNSETGGLKGGEFACYNKDVVNKMYTQCNAADLAGGNQMVTTNSVAKESEFKPLVSNPVASQKTIAKQNQRTKWTTDKNVQASNSVALIALMAVFGIIFLIAIFSCIIYCLCWKGSASTIDKSHIEAVEEGTGTNTGNADVGQDGSLPVIS